MTAEQFAMWLHGYLEIENPKEIGEVQTQIIKDHLDLLFKKETPDRKKDDIPDFKKIYEETVKVKQPSIFIQPTQPAIGNVCLGCGKAQCSGLGLGCRSLIATC